MTFTVIDFPFSTTVESYIRRHEDRDMVGASSDASTTNPWSNNDTRSLPGQPQSSENVGRPLLKQAQSQNGGCQMLLLLLRLRQCCCHLSLMKDVRNFTLVGGGSSDLSRSKLSYFLSLLRFLPRMPLSTS